MVFAPLDENSLATSAVAPEFAPGAAPAAHPSGPLVSVGAQLPAVEEQFRAVWDAAADGMALSDRNAVVLAANKAYLDLYGYPAEDVIGKNFAVIFPPEVREWANEEYHRTFAEPEVVPSVEATIQRKDGSIRYVDSRYTFLTQNGERIAMISIVRDITARKEMEQRLRESDERFRLALSKSPVVVSNQDIDLRYTWVYNPNPAVSPHTMIGRTDFDMLPRAEAEALTAIKRKVLASGESIRQEVVTTLGGEPYYYDLTTEPIRDRSGDIIGITCAAFDITERKRAEAERAQLLEREQDAHASARRAVLMRDQVLSTVAHDLRNALTSIKGYAQILKSRMQHYSGQVQPDKVSEGLARIDDAVNRMDGQIGELLDTARLQIGQPLDLERVPTDLVRLAQEAVEACRQGAPEHTLEFHADLPEIVGEWDAPRLRRVVDNLLGNAVKYSARGGEVRVRVALKVDTAVLQVEDNGIGIPEEDRPHIFEWFYRAGNAPEGVAGTGIGLAGAQHVVQQHGGTIAVESKVGVGTRFTVQLPI